MSVLLRFKNNVPGTFTTRLNQSLHYPAGARLALEEISLQCAYKQDESEATMEIYDWLFPIYEPQPPQPSPGPSPAPTPIPVKPKGKIIAYGKKFLVKLGHIDVANGNQLVALINGEIWKVMPRVKRQKASLFSYNKDQNCIYLEFPEKKYYYTIVLNYKTLELLGMLQHATKGEFFVVGRSKPEASYEFTTKDGIKETRKFDKPLFKAIPSREQRKNFFL